MAPPVKRRKMEYTGAGPKKDEAVAEITTNNDNT
jgi:hypothetical protein